MTKFCPNCGETFDGAAQLCPYDGADLEERRDREDSNIGRVVDNRFRLESLLGKGGMGRVYEATQLSVGRRVAVKMIRIGGLDRKRVKRRFFREAKVVSELSHPNIVTLLEFGEDDELEVPYIAMEYIDGLDVRDALDDSRLHPRVAVEIAAQIAAALVEAHEAEIIHRDLKTDNVLLVPVSSGGFQAKVIDFGIALPRENSETLTNSGMICGTPKYVSPEQARNGEIDARTDLYSLGVVLYEIIVGELPFESDSALNVMMKHLREPPPDISERLGPDEVPSSLRRLVDDLLAKEPDDRPADARAVRRRLKSIQTSQNWQPLELDNGATMREKLQPWVLPAAPPADAPSPDAQKDGGALLGTTDDDPPPAFSAPSLRSGSPISRTRSEPPVQVKVEAGGGRETTPGWRRTPSSNPDRNGSTEPEIVGVPRDADEVDEPTAKPSETSRDAGSRRATADGERTTDDAENLDTDPSYRPIAALVFASALLALGAAVFWMTSAGESPESNGTVAPSSDEPDRTRATPKTEPTGNAGPDPRGGSLQIAPPRAHPSDDTSNDEDAEPDAGGEPVAEENAPEPTEKPDQSGPPRPPEGGADSPSEDEQLAEEINEELDWSISE